MPDIEARSCDEAVRKVRSAGFAIWRNLLAADLCDALRANAQAVYEQSDAQGHHDLIASRDYNTAFLEAFDGPGERLRILRHLLDTPLISIFDRLVGANWVISHDESPIFKSNGSQSRETTPTFWHQDACVNQYPTALVWIALTPCGEDAPGLKLVCASPDEPIELFREEHSDDAPKERFIERNYGSDSVVRPTFAPGDALFFNHLTIHGTHVTAGMTRDRLSFKITGVGRGDIEKVANPIDPRTAMIMNQSWRITAPLRKARTWLRSLG